VIGMHSTVQTHTHTQSGYFTFRNIAPQVGDQATAGTQSTTGAAAAASYEPAVEKSQAAAPCRHTSGQLAHASRAGRGAVAAAATPTEVVGQLVHPPIASGRK